jgi:hypothetical protein
MSLEDNVRLGRMAINEVRSLPILASNKVGDRLRPAGGVDNVVGHGFDVTASHGVGFTRESGVRAMTIANLRGTVEYVRRTGYGNCWGQEAVWCDPWQGDNGVVFAVSDPVRGAVRNLNAIYKCNTCERVEEGLPGSLLLAD